MNKIRQQIGWDRLRATYWFLPLAMTICALALAIAFFELDRAVPPQDLQNQWFFLLGDMAGARSIMLNIAATALGVMGVVFSVTLVPLSIASSQYGSSILRAFMRDVPTQVVLGTYGATIAYSMAVALRLSSGMPADTMPRLSATFGLVMLLASLVLLIYFFHHIAASLRSTRVLALISEELGHVIEDDFPVSNAAENVSQRAAHEEIRLKILQKGQTILAHSTGYIGAWDFTGLTESACKFDLVLLMRKVTGDFVAAGGPLLTAWPAAKPCIRAAAVELNNSCIIGESRTMVQDVRFGINQIVVIASRALSPAVNDPETPVLCINRLGSALGMIAEREMPAKYYCGKDGAIRIIVEHPGFDQLVEAAFSQIRQYGRGTAEVLLHMLEALQSVALHVKRDTDRAVLLEHAALIEQDSRTGLPSEYDRQRVQIAYGEAVRAISQTSAANPHGQKAQYERVTSGPGP